VGLLIVMITGRLPAVQRLPAPILSRPPVAEPCNLSLLEQAPSISASTFVAKDKLYFVSTDPAGSDRIGGLAVSQDTTISFSNATLNGNTVFSLSNVEESTLSKVAAVGILNANGAGALGSGSMCDENNAGVIIPSRTLSGSYTMGVMAVALFPCPEACPLRPL